MKWCTCSTASNGRLKQLALLTLHWQPKPQRRWVAAPLTQSRACSILLINTVINKKKVGASACAPTVLFGGGGVRKHLAAEKGQVPGTGCCCSASALPTSLPLLGSRCVSPDDVNVSSSGAVSRTAAWAGKQTHKRYRGGLQQPNADNSVRTPAIFTIIWIIGPS